MQNNSIHITINATTIIQWAEKRGGYPAIAKDKADVDKGSLLFIGFNSEENDSIDEISWDHFFDEFEENNLAFEYQEEVADGTISKKYKFVDRDEHRHELEK